MVCVLHMAAGAGVALGWRVCLYGGSPSVSLDIEAMNLNWWTDRASLS